MELFRLLGLIIVNNSEALKNIDDTTDKAEKSEGEISKAFGKIGSAALKIGAAVGTAAVTAGAAITKMAVSAYADYEQLVGGVDTLFKESSAKVQAYANNAYKTAGLSANEYMETVTSFSASLLQSLGGDTAKAADAANVAITDMADNANKMGTSMEMIQNAYQGFAKQNYTMLDNLKLGYGGTKEEMQRLLKDAQKLSGVKYDMSNLNDVYQAIHVIQTELGITGTTAKEASATISGSIAAMKSSWQNFLVGLADGNQDMTALTQNLVSSIETVGANLVPRVITTVKTLGTVLTDNVKTYGGEAIDMFSQAFTEKLPQLVQSGAEILTRIGEGFAAGMPSLMEKALPLIANFTGKLRENASTLISTGLNMIVNLGKGLANSLPALITYVPTIVSNIANIINDNAPKVLMSGLELIVTLGKGLLQAIPTLVQNIPKIISAIVDVFTAFQWLNLGKSLMVKFKDGIIAATNAVKSAATSIKDTVVNAIKSLPSKLFELAENAIEQIVLALRNTKTVSETVKALGNVIINGIKTIPSKMLSIGTDIVKGLWNGIGNAKSWIMSKIKGFGQGILDEMKDFFGIKSPSRVMRDEVGEQLALGVAEGIDKNADRVKKTVAVLSETTLETAKAYSFTPSFVNYNSESVRTNDIQGQFDGVETKDQSALFQRVIALLEYIAEKDTAVYLNSKEISKAVNKDLGVIY